jgi:hypothetical protein
MKKVWLYLIFVSLLISLVDWHATAQQGIVIDGKMDDWQGIPPILEDIQGDVRNAKDKRGVDLRALYAVMDDKYLYFIIQTYDDFTQESLRNFFIGLDYNGDGNDEWHFGVRPSGENWVFDLQKDSSWNTYYWPAPEVHTVGGNRIIESSILRSKYAIPSKLRVYMRVTEGAQSVDTTSYSSLENDFGKYSALINSGIANYKSAQDSINAKELPKAKEELLKSKDAFTKAKQIYPGRNLPEQASKIDENISKIDTIAQADAIFQEATNFYDSEDYESAKIKFSAAKKIYEGIGDVTKSSDCDIMLSKIENSLKAKQEADSTFNDAKSAFDAQDYQKAKDLFTQAKQKFTELNEAEMVKQCDDYITKIEEALTKKTGIEIYAVVTGILMSIGCLKRRDNK